jgi:hypothetical protein
MTNKLEWKSVPEGDVARGDVTDSRGRYTLRYSAVPQDGRVIASVVAVGRQFSCPLGRYRSPTEARRVCEEHYTESCKPNL